MAILYRKIERGWFNWPKVYEKWAETVPEDGHIVEVGAHQGKSTLFLLEKLYENGKFRKTRFDVNDIFGMHWGEIWFIINNLNEAIMPNGVRAIAGVNIMQINSRESFRIYQENSLDFIMIDGDHSYDGCMSDLINFYSKLKPGGEMAVHDYNHPHIPDVKRAVDDFMTSTFHGGNTPQHYINSDSLEFGHQCDTYVICKPKPGVNNDIAETPLKSKSKSA